MRQVPTYLAIGRGRVARHFVRYLSLLNISVLQWHRDMPVGDLSAMAERATHILVLVSDRAIEDVIRTRLQDSRAVIVHFSGALVTPLAHGAHPLMTFGPADYSFEKYKSIPFVIDESAPPFETLLPGLPNPHARLSPEMKTKYHAICCMAGNFTCLLWQKLFDSFAEEFNLLPEIAVPYMRQQIENLSADYKSALTGPLARGDGVTIQKHLDALQGDAFHQVYDSFVKAYKEKQV